MLGTPTKLDIIQRIRATVCMTEEWREIAGYEGLYEVSSAGNVRSKDRIVGGPCGSISHRVGGLHPQKTDAKGYQLVALSRGCGAKWVRVHRLVAEAFIPNPDVKSQVDHVDRCKSNNAVSNLRWATPKENAANKGLYVSNSLGEANICATPTGFRVQAKKGDLRTSRRFKTLDEAKAYRLEVLGF